MEGWNVNEKTSTIHINYFSSVISDGYYFMKSRLEDSFYLTEDKALVRLWELTELAPDEVEEIVGRFKPDHHNWPGQLKGQVIVSPEGIVRIVHHFTKKTLWTNDWRV